LTLFLILLKRPHLHLNVQRNSNETHLAYLQILISKVDTGKLPLNHNCTCKVPRKYATLVGCSLENSSKNVQKIKVEKVKEIYGPGPISK